MDVKGLATLAGAARRSVLGDKSNVSSTVLPTRLIDVSTKIEPH